MTSADMVAAVKSRTQDTNDAKVLTELNAAQDWAFNHIYNAEGGPDLLVTFNEQKTLTSVREYDLTSNLTYVIMGLKKLWLKLPNETKFTPMLPADTTEPNFVWRDDVDDTTVATSHPVYYMVENFAQLRFSALLPSNAILRVDYFRMPPAIDPTLNNTLSNGSDLPTTFHQVLVDYATGLRYVGQDDDRATGYISTANTNLATALYGIKRRVQAPTTTQPYRSGRRRSIV